MDNNIIEIPEDNILMSFEMDNQEYVVLSDNEENDEEEISIYFAKRDLFENQFNIIRSIEDDNEYEKVVATYEEIINIMEEQDEQKDD